ncbi:MAG: glycosyltransferase [Solirubrobacteraceae bacterium]
MRVALLLSTDYFEDFYGQGFGLSPAEYVASYRNDWSWDWCRVLRAEGVQPSLYLPSLTERSRFETDERVGVRFLPLGAIVRPWTALPPLRRTPVGRYAAQLANTAGFLRPLRWALAEDQIDVLLIQEYWTARFDLLVRRLAVPVVGVDQGLPDRHELKVIKRGSFRAAAGVITQTEREADKVRRYRGAAIRIANAVDSDLFAPAQRSDGQETRRILAVGRIHDAQKRHSDLVRALARLPESWTLEIVGRGPDEDDLRRLATELGVGDRLGMPGFVSDKRELRDRYRAATVFAVPSAYEGLPMTLLEAMSCGTPAVGSDIAAIAEVLDSRSGQLVAVGDVEGLANAFRHCLEHRNALSAGARETVLQQYSTHVVGPALREYLHNVVFPPGQDG